MVLDCGYRTWGSPKKVVNPLNPNYQSTTAYRYSQASTATVFLDHWDYTMDTNSGNIGAENDWVVGLPNNAMTKTTASDGKVEWTKTFENLQAGTYDFKVQANTSWAYNYNENGFNGNQNI